MMNKTRVICAILAFACLPALTDLRAQDPDAVDIADIRNPAQRELDFMVAQSLLTKEQADSIDEATQKEQAKLLEPLTPGILGMIGKDIRVLPNKLLDILLERAAEYANPELLTQHRADLEKTKALFAMLEQKEVTRFLNREFSLSAKQRETLEKKLQEIWTPKIAKKCSRLRFDGFPGSGNFATEIELESVLTESQAQLFDIQKWSGKNLNKLSEMALADSNEWTDVLESRFKLCVEIELNRLNEFRDIPDADRKRFSVATKKIISDQIKERKKWFGSIRDNRTNAYSNPRLFKHFFDPPMDRLKQSRVWQNTCKKLLTGNTLKNFEVDQVAQKELLDRAIAHSNLINIFEAARCRHSEIQSVYELAIKLNAEEFPTEIPSFFVHRILEVPNQTLRDCFSEQGWNAVKNNVASLRESRRKSIERYKSHQKAELAEAEESEEEERD